MPDILVVAAVPLRILRGCPIVLDLHDLMPELMASKVGNARALTRLLQWQESVGVRTADTVMTVNENCARLLRQRHPGVQVSTVPNSPDERTFLRRAPRLRTPGGCVRIGYHGTVAKRFGVATLLSGFRRLRQEGVEATLDVWGGGDDLDTVKSLARTLGIGEHVRFHGQTPVDLLVEMLQDLDVSVVPYEADAYMAIAYSTKAFELAALGIPIVISDLSGIREQFTEKAVAYFAPGDADSLARTLIQVVGDPSSAQQMAIRAQAELDNFSWSAIAISYVKKIENTIVTKCRI